MHVVAVRPDDVRRTHKVSVCLTVAVMTTGLRNVSWIATKFNCYIFCVGLRLYQCCDNYYYRDLIGFILDRCKIF